MGNSNVNIKELKDTYISMLRQLKRDPEGVERLINYLEQSDFFTAPASSRHHSAFEGGLCAHSLNVYVNLHNMVTQKPEIKQLLQEDGIPEDSINESLVIVALLHDLAKVNFYEPSYINKKVYCDGGSKRDNLGNFEWVSEKVFKVRETNQRFIFGTHGQNSERLASTFLPLYDAESCAIINHHSVYDNPSLDISPIYNRYTLAVLLHLADMMATYVDEKI